jgi:hypothetical protein
MMRLVLLFALSLLGFWSCNKRKVATIIAKSGQKTVAKPTASLKKPKTIDQDSINLGTMMHDVLLYAYKHRNTTYQKKKLSSWNFGYDSGAVLSFGYFFSPKTKHLIVKRMLWGTTLAVDVFVYKNSKFKAVCSQSLNNLTFLDYTITDVNGDHLKDFLIHWYPSSGCCRRDIYDVYLNRSDGKFTKNYEFINPTFSAHKK